MDENPFISRHKQSYFSSISFFKLNYRTFGNWKLNIHMNYSIFVNNLMYYFIEFNNIEYEQAYNNLS